MTETLLRRIMRHEGCVKQGERHVLYADSLGIQTIGYGRNIQERGLSEDEAQYLLHADLSAAQNELSRAYPWTDKMDAARRDVLVEMVFNMGLRRFSRFVRMLAAAHREDWETCAHEMLDSKWAAQVGVRAVELAAVMWSGDLTR